MGSINGGGRLIAAGVVGIAAVAHQMERAQEKREQPTPTSLQQRLNAMLLAGPPIWWSFF